MQDAVLSRAVAGTTPTPRRGPWQHAGQRHGHLVDAEAPVGIEDEVVLRRVRSEGVDLVISDLVLPPMDGVGLRQAIRDDPLHGHLPVLLISGEQEAALPYSPDDAFLAKPFNARELLAAVRRLLNLNGDGL